MRLTLIIVMVLLFALLGLSCSSELALSISVTEIPNGIQIENTGDVDCLVFVTSANGEERFDLPIGGTLVVFNVSKPIEVSAVVR